MIPEVNLTYAFSFQIKYKVYYFVTEASHGNDVNSNVDPQIDSASSTDVEDSDDDVKLVSFVCSRKTVSINQPLKSRLFLHLFTSQTLIPIAQSVVFSVHQLRGQDAAGRSLPAMPAAGEMQNLSPSSGSALLPRKGHLSRVSAQDDENARSACRGRGRQRNHYTDIITKHILRRLY